MNSGQEILVAKQEIFIWSISFGKQKKDHQHKRQKSLVFDEPNEFNKKGSKIKGAIG